jgi:Zn-dependent protease with chaperone function
MSSVGVDFDFAKWIAARRGSQEQQAREGAAYAFSGELKFRRTLAIARPVTMALEATTRLWRDVARAELLGTAVKASDATYAPVLARVSEAAKAASNTLHVKVPPIFGIPKTEIGIRVLGTDDAPHLIVDLDLASKLDHAELVAAIGHELAHVQNGHIPFATALYYLTHSAAFFIRWIIKPAIMTLQAWSRRAEVTCDRAALLAVKDLDKALTGLVKQELGADKGAAFDAAEYLRSVPEPKKGLGRFGELFRSHPYVPKRVHALRLFATSALFASVTGQDTAGKPTAAEIDKQVADLISVF